MVSDTRSTLALKRKASSELQDEPVKRSRSGSVESGAEERSELTGETEETEVERLKSGNKSLAKQIVLLERELAESREGDGEAAELEQMRLEKEKLLGDIVLLNKELAQMKEDCVEPSELVELREKASHWRLRFFELEDKYDTLISVTSSKGSTAAVNKKIEQSIIAEWKEKLENQKASYESKIDKLKKESEHKVNKKHALYQKTLDERKAKHAGELKEKKDACDKKLADWKATYTTKLNAAQNAAKELKPEHSQAVKEKDQRIEKLKADKAEVQKTLENTREEVRLCEVAIEKRDEEKETLDHVVEQERAGKAVLEVKLGEQQKQTSELQREQEEGIAAFKRRIDKESERWQLQYEKAENLGFKLVEQQRGNFELKNMCKLRDQRIVALNLEIDELKGGIGRHKGRICVLEAETGKLREELHGDRLSEDHLPGVLDQAQTAPMSAEGSSEVLGDAKLLGRETTTHGNNPMADASVEQTVEAELSGEDAKPIVPQVDCDDAI